MGILTKNVYGVDVVSLFENGITIDQKLPKWVNASKRLEEKKKAKKNNSPEVVESGYTMNTYLNDPGTTTGFGNVGTPFVVYNTPEHYEIKDGKVDFDKVAAASLQELTEIIKDGELNNVLSGYGGMHGWSNNTVEVNNGYVGPRTSETKNGLFSGLFEKLRARFNKPELDVVDFFTDVKLTSKESAENYRDRVSKYVKAVHDAKSVNQTALVEKLLSEMIANKYESLLYAQGKYYVVTEEQLVNFAKKTDRGVDLCYIKNYTRPIPAEVISKVGEMNQLEVFDNFVILHYDPKGEHKKETKREVAKRKDPIIFGVIAGSHKLYYVADWIDEYCDLTLEKFVDTINVEKKSLLEGDGPDPVEEKPADEGKVKKPRKRRTTKKEKTEE